MSLGGLLMLHMLTSMLHHFCYPLVSVCKVVVNPNKIQVEFLKFGYQGHMGDHVKRLLEIKKTLLNPHTSLFRSAWSKGIVSEPDSRKIRRRVWEIG